MSLLCLALHPCHHKKIFSKYSARLFLISSLSKRIFSSLALMQPVVFFLALLLNSFIFLCLACSLLARDKSSKSLQLSDRHFSFALLHSLTIFLFFCFRIPVIGFCPFCVLP